MPIRGNSRGKMTLQEGTGGGKRRPGRPKEPLEGLGENTKSAKQNQRPRKFSGNFYRKCLKSPKAVTWHEATGGEAQSKEAYAEPGKRSSTGK